MKSLVRPILLLAGCLVPAVAQPGFRPPAVPLVAHDPYFSVWSMADKLTGEPTRHWTGKTQSLVGLVRVDGETFRIAGVVPRETAPEMPQTGLEVLPTRTIYRFAGQGIAVTLTFLTPALPRDIEVLSRPATYVVWEVRSTDQREHEVSLYLDASKELAVNLPQQRVAWGRYKLEDVAVLRMGTEQQPVLQSSGDDLRIDWGYLYMAAPPAGGVALAATGRLAAVRFFKQTGRVPDADDLDADSEARGSMPVLGIQRQPGAGLDGRSPATWCWPTTTLFSVEYFSRRLASVLAWRTDRRRPACCWRRCGSTRRWPRAAGGWTKNLMADLRLAGGEEYARLAALAYRQTLAAHKVTCWTSTAPP